MTAAVLDAAAAEAEFAAAGDAWRRRHAAGELRCSPPPRKKRKPEPEHRRTHAPVRAGSIAVGRELPAPRLTRAEAEMRKRSMQDFAAKHRPDGRRRGGWRSVGWVALAVYNHLVDWAVTHVSGIHPSIKAIAQAVGTDPATVCRSLATLKHHGFVDWDRRFRPTGQRGARGPQVHQATNWYYLPLPSGIQRALAWWLEAGATKRTRRAVAGIRHLVDGLPAAIRERARREARYESATALVAGAQRSRKRDSS